MIVCSCHAVTDREIRRLARAGACSVREVAESCGAGSACGGCRSAVVAILRDSEAPRERSDSGSISSAISGAT
ncbi:MAG: bacterioferritin-associated ferredoxin [Myxococcota bacterium]